MGKLIRILLLTSGAVLLFFVVTFFIFDNFNYGILIICAISSILILYGLFFDKLVRIKWLTFSIIAICSLYLSLMLFIGFYGRNDNVTYSEDVIIVLGAAVRGERVSLLLSDRLDKAVEYCEKNPNALIVVSGGQGPMEDITEALAMERYLIARGLPKERIIKEEESSTSFENIQNSKEVLDKLYDRPYKSAIITNDFHIFRAVKMAEQIGIKTAHYHAKIKWNFIPLNYSRECMAILWFFIFGN